MHNKAFDTCCELPSEKLCCCSSYDATHQGLHSIFFSFKSSVFKNGLTAAKGMCIFPSNFPRDNFCVFGLPLARILNIQRAFPASCGHHRALDSCKGSFFGACSPGREMTSSPSPWERLITCGSERSLEASFLQSLPLRLCPSPTLQDPWGFLTNLGVFGSTQVKLKQACEINNQSMTKIHVPQSLWSCAVQCSSR